MSQTHLLTKALKRCLRTRGLTYRDVASALGLSESSIKRLFSEQTFTLQRLEEICHLLEMSMFDLLRVAAADDDHHSNELDLAHEQALADDPTLLAYFYLLLIGWQPQRIARRLDLDEAGQRACLTRLTALRLIETLPRNRVRLLTDSRIKWRPGGPIRSRYERHAKREFVDHEFAGPDETLALENAELSPASIKVLRRKIARLVEEFAELSELDRSLPHEDKRGFGLLIGARAWTFWNTVGNLPELNDQSTSDAARRARRDS